jgi:predicted RNase H-like HicB family nuclease
MTDSAKYIKIVEWSDEDQAFVGRCPGIVGACCHGADEVEVYRELCEIVEEWVEIMKADGTPLPPATIGMGLTPVVSN